MLHPLLDPTRATVIAHRGDRAHAPENTLVAFERGLTTGADALECDVHRTADGEIVVIHDDTVDRTTSGTGPVHACTSAALRRLDAGCRFTRDGGATWPFRDQGITIPTLGQLLERFPDTPLVIEVKTPEAAPGTLALLRRYGAMHRAIVGSRHPEALAPFRAAGVPVSASEPEIRQLYWRTVLPFPIPRPSWQFLCIPPREHRTVLPVLRMVRRLRRHAIPVIVWTVNDPAEAVRYWQGGVQGIITDDPGAILQAAHRAGLRSTPAPRLS